MSPLTVTVKPMSLQTSERRFLSSFSWLSKNACDLIRVKESQKKNGTIQKSLFTKPDKEARLIVQL